MSASMGAGHDGAARELQTRLKARGHHAEVVDFLAQFPIGLGWFFRYLYAGMLSKAPWTYSLIYKVFPYLYWPFSFAEHHITRRRVKKLLKAEQPDVVVSTYPLASLAFGRMRQGGKLSVPVITYITDFHPYPLVTHEGVDLHVAVHDITRDGAIARISGPVVTRSPLVSERFKPAARANDGRTNVMVCAGSWGAGEVEQTVRDLTSIEGVDVTVMCGRNTELQQRIDGIKNATAIGWTTQMPELMAAADVLIDNAGGLTAMEALAAGVPVINYRSLVGHGIDNAADMQTAGVVTLAHTPDELDAAVRKLAHDKEARDRQITAGLAMYGNDMTDDVLAYARGEGVPLAQVVPLKSARKHPKRRRRTFGAVAAAGLAASMALTTGVGVATAHGIGVGDEAHPVGTYVGVRVTAKELNDPAIRIELKKLPVTVIVDGRTAMASSDALHELAANGVDIANGGSGRHDPGWTPWSRAQLDLEQGASQVSASSGTEVHTFVPGRRLDTFDFFFARHTHGQDLPTAKTVKPGCEDRLGQSDGIYVIDGRGETNNEFLQRLNKLSKQTGVQSLAALP